MMGFRIRRGAVCFGAAAMSIPVVLLGVTVFAASDQPTAPPEPGATVAGTRAPVQDAVTKPKGALSAGQGLEHRPARDVGRGAGQVEPGAVVQASQVALSRSRANAINGQLRVARSDVIRVNLPAGDVDAMALDMPLDGLEGILSLERTSVRGPDYQVFESRADGTLVPVAPGPERNYRGHLVDDPRSVAAASILDDGLHAIIRRSDGLRFVIEPLAPYDPQAAADEHVVYLSDDLEPREGQCDTPNVQIDVPGGPVEGGVAGGGVCVTELGCDADFEFFQIFGSVAAVEAEINAVINQVNVQYETQVGITHVITGIIVRSNVNDPYSATNSLDAVCEFSIEWWNNVAIVRDVAHLFTGRNFGGIIGRAAEIGSICEPQSCPSFPCTCNPSFNTEGSYCFSRTEFDPSFACSTDLVAHELGHLWGAVHCSCPSNTMNPIITCANNFSAASITDIIAYRDTRPCLDCGAAPNPVCPSGGNCFAAHPWPGCADEDCCNTVCALDPFCCDNQWDNICADEALANCGQSCGHPNAGDCFVPNGTPYCDNFACCQAVCAIDPFCCNVEWDQLCADEATDICCVGLTTIDFEDLAVPPGQQINTPDGVGIVTNGFNYDPGPINDAPFNQLYISNKQNFWSYNGTTVGGTNDDVIISRVDGQPFELRQFDFAGFPVDNEIPFTVENLDTGQILNFTPDGITDGGPAGAVDFQTFSIAPGFVGTQFHFAHFGPGTVQGLFALDNIVTCPPPAPEPCPGARIDFGVTPDDFGNPNDCAGGNTVITTQYVFTQDIVFGTAVDNFSPPPVEILNDGACSPACRSSGIPAFASDWWCQFRIGAAPGQPGQIAGVPTFSAELCFIDGPIGTILMEGYNNSRQLIATAASTQNGTEVLTITAPPGELIAYVRVVSSDPNKPAGLSIDCLAYPDPIPRVPTDLVNFFLDPVQFESVVTDAGKLLKGDETFEEAVIADGGVAAMDDPLDTNTNNGIFSPGDILYNLAFQSNQDGPGLNGPNPSGVSGLAALGTGFAGNPDKGVSCNFFPDSFDVLSLNPNHTAIGMRVISIFGASPVLVSVFDKNEQLVGQTTISATPAGAFIGIFMKNRETFSRINLWSPDQQAEGVLNVEAYINVDEKCPWDCADNNGVVDILDLLALLSQWNGPGSCDFDNNGVVNIVDLLALLGAWGPCPACPAPGNCFEPHPNPGCALQDCCNQVCAIDPFCCEVEWDQLCADEAIAICQNFIEAVFDPSGLNQGPYSVEDFEDGTFLPGATYSCGSAIPPTLTLASSAAGGVTPSGVQGLLSGTFRDTIIVDFTSPVTSGGLWFGNDDTCCSTGFDARLELFDAGGSLGTIDLTANMNDFADQFIGFNSNKQIVRMIIHYGNDTEGLFIYIDDCYFN